MAGVRYTAVAVALHWLIAVAIIFMLALGLYMGGLENNADKFALYQLHKSLGITILALSLVRLLWRLGHKPPALPPMPAAEKFAALAAHKIFYALMIGLPLVGWLAVSASPMKMPTRIFKLFTLPDLPLPALLAGDDPARAADRLFALHAYLAYATIALLVLHVAAACKHHFFDRDDVLLHMAPRWSGALLRRLRPGKPAAAP